MTARKVPNPEAASAPRPETGHPMPGFRRDKGVQRLHPLML